MRARTGFSMVEILVTFMFVSFAFLPIYNLFRFGLRGTVSNEREIESTNYASDLINFLRSQKIADLDAKFPEAKSTSFTTLDDKVVFTRLQVDEQGFPMNKGFRRTLLIRRFKGADTGSSNPNSGFWTALGGKIRDYYDDRVSVPNYLIHVRVKHEAQGKTEPDDEIFLSAIVMD